jgi:hypothetical protein
MSEGTNDSNDITSHAIEDGSDISDHVISKPRTFSLDVVLSDEIIDAQDPNSIINRFTATIKDRLGIIENWLTNKDVLTYYAFEEDFEDVVIQSISKKKSLDVGSGVGLNIVLMRINIADSESVNVKIKQQPAKAQAKASTEKHQLKSKFKEKGFSFL